MAAPHHPGMYPISHRCQRIIPLSSPTMSNLYPRSGRRKPRSVGTHLELAPDAILEMYRLVSHGEVIDIALRYRSLAKAGLMTMNRIDELLDYYPDLH